MIEERVVVWYKSANNTLKGVKRLPGKVLFYRDGVSESQYGMVKFEDLPQISQGCAAALATLKADKSSGISSDTAWKPELTLIVVTKRHHSRFYPRKLLLT